MSKQITNSQVTRELLSHLEETFAQVKGIYLDRGTSLLETLATLSAAEASKSFTKSGSGTTIAGHVAHVRFYLKVMIDYMAGQKNQTLDWKQSWLVKTVDERQWKHLQKDLHSDYEQIRDSWSSSIDWAGEDQIGAAVAVLVHTAYHLGSIRQLSQFAKS